jgi:phage recombination protein Bet
MGALVKAEPTTLDVPRVVAGSVLGREQIELVKRTIAKDATDDELALFLQQCQRTGLDPFNKQIYAIKRWDSEQRREVMAVQVGIDGFRLIAQRTGQYAGQTPVQWCGADGVWRDVWLDDEAPKAARVGVLRRDFSAPLYAVATLAEFAQTKKDGGFTKFWKQMPAVMLGKCAESAALRKAFPLELSGLYTPEESEVMHEDAPEAPLPPRAEITEALRLPGNKTSFGGHGGQRLDECPTSVLVAFSRWTHEDDKRTRRYAIAAAAADEIILRRQAADEADTAAAPDVEVAA